MLGVGVGVGVEVEVLEQENNPTTQMQVINIKLNITNLLTKDFKISRASTFKCPINSMTIK